MKSALKSVRKYLFIEKPNIPFFFLGLLFILFCFSSCKEETTEPTPTSIDIKLGAILDLSGIYSEAGRAGKAAIEIAIEKINEKYQSVGSPLRFSCTFLDTKLDTNSALTAAQEMFSKGIRILVGGPNSSAELRAIKSYLDEKQMVTLNCFSTAPSLAIADDYIFRMITDDNFQGQAVLKMLQHKNIKALIPIYRTDTYGTGLYESVKQKFQAQGGIVLQGVSYSPASSNYQEMMNDIGNQVNTAIASYGASNVAVMLISYQDAYNFLNAAANVPQLKTVHWLGCDANAQKDAIINDTIAARFAAEVKFIAPIMGVGTASFTPATAAEIAALILNKSGLKSDAYALSCYDAVKIIAQAYDFVQSYNSTKIKAILPDICSAYNYLGISRSLNTAGDLESANYIFWTVNAVSGSYVWESYATYIANGDYIQIKN